MSATRVGNWSFVGMRRPSRLLDPRGPERLARLFSGLVGFGFSLALMVEARLGLGPWDVFHQGVADVLRVEIGWIVIGVGAAALLAWIPLRERPGLGTVANVVVVGLVVNVSLDLLPAATGMLAKALLLGGGIILNGVATGLYIGAGLGPGPRDGIMTGIARRGYSLRAVRTVIELGVLAGGAALGGTIGVGTVAYALAIGPLVHFFLPRLAMPARQIERRPELAACGAGE
ncbi:MAG: YczE/YyaS/YitT family protein [Acidimicrobiia bacterium]